MEDRPDIRPATLYILILKTLAHRGAMQIQHPALQRMLVKGWVVAEWKQSENNRRARFYKRTAGGRKQLARELREFDQVMGAIARVIHAV